MMTGFAEAWILAAQLDDIREPYRQNAIAWLETCTQRRLTLPRRDLLAFLEELHPFVRADFLRHTGSVLDDAVRHFGKPGASTFRTSARQGQDLRQGGP
jgi:hypothetical protein